MRVWYEIMKGKTRDEDLPAGRQGLGFRV